MKNTKTTYRRMVRERCPRCGHTYSGYPALSRVDDETYICSNCGTIEGLKWFVLAQEGKEEAEMRAILAEDYAEQEVASGR